MPPSVRPAPRRPLVAAVLAAVAMPTIAAAQGSAFDKLQIHGFITQGYAESTDLPVNGIPTDATGDYRTAALQFRYALADRDNVVLQLRHRRLGGSPFAAGESDVHVNWAFYQHRFTGATLKVGKMPIPRGIYNEIRSVGTVIPFYRAPLNFYLEGQETLDGATLTNAFSVGQWSLETTGWGGGYDARSVRADARTGVPTAIATRNERAFGGQAWLATPVEGLRLGLGGLRYRARKATDTSTTPTSSQWFASVDGNFNRVLARAEYAHIASPGRFINLYYVQGGVKVTDKFAVYAQNDFSNYHVATAPSVYRYYRNSGDFGATANFAPNPNLVFKAEWHKIKGYNFDAPVNANGPAARSKYFILSASTSF